MKKKILAVILACALSVGIGIGGTMAWLTAGSSTVTNTFTVGDITIHLQEHVYDPTEKALGDNTTTSGNDNYKFVPGDTLPKDPYVTIDTTSEACYLFIHVEELNNTITVDGEDEPIIRYAVDTSVWTAYDGYDGFYYQELDADDIAAGDPWYILTGGTTENLNGQVTVSENVTKDDVATIKTSQPQLIFTAAAVQSDHVDTVDDAWARLPSEFTGITPST